MVIYFSFHSGRWLRIKHITYCKSSRWCLFSLFLLLYRKRVFFRFGFVFCCCCCCAFFSPLLLSIKWQLKLLNYTFIEIYEFVNQNLWLGARQDHWLDTSDSCGAHRNIDGPMKWNERRHRRRMGLMLFRFGASRNRPERLCGLGVLEDITFAIASVVFKCVEYTRLVIVRCAFEIDYIAK